MFSIGQVVYVKNDIRGWFDYSCSFYIPKNAACVIEQFHEKLSSYDVKFIGKWAEFGSAIIEENNLKEDNG